MILVAHVVQMRNVYKILVGKHVRKKPLDRPRRRWKDIINAHIKERVCEYVYCIH
jgi:hypothetical protein